MANSMSVQIPATGTPVSSPGSVAAGGAVTFKNQAKATARVDFGNKSPFCPQTTVYTLKAGKSQTLTVCTNFGIGGTYNYLSTVTGAQAQSATLVIDMWAPGTPIVFPERKPIVFPEDWIPMLVGLAIGVIIGYLGGRRRLARPG